MGRYESEAAEVFPRPSLPAGRREERIKREILQADHCTDAEGLRRWVSAREEARGGPASEARPYHSNFGSTGESGIQEGGETSSHRCGEEGGGDEAGCVGHRGGKASAFS